MRIAMGIEYDGTAYNGWQRQKTGTGIQAVLEAALATVADQPVETVCAGRTDAGVHAAGQVVHFDTNASRCERGWLLGANSNLPDDVNVGWVASVDDVFHARYSATARTYRYLILNRPVRSALARHRAWWLYQPLDIDLMREAAGRLLGKHDFSAFRAAGCQASTPIRELMDIDIERHGDWIGITVTANAFLQHMVRNITGLLAAIGSGERPASSAAEVLRSRDRTSGGVAAPAHGLMLLRVDYPPQFDLPLSTVPALSEARFRL